METTKQAQEVSFSRKLKKTVDPSLLFNNARVAPTSSQKHLVFGKIRKTIGLLRKLHNFLPRAALITIYKAFIRPHNLCLKVYDGNLGDMLT